MSRRGHACGWPGCDQRVASWQWGCASHFGKLLKGLRDQLTRVKPHWPECRQLRSEATSWAREQLIEERRAAAIEARIQQEACRVCGGPSAKRLVRLCLPCNSAAFTGEKI